MLIEVIRGARERITLSLFRCNDEEILAELAVGDQPRRGGRSAGDVARQGWAKAASRSCGARSTHRRRAQRLHRSGRQVPRQVPRRRRRPGGRGIAELHPEVFPQDLRRAGRHARSGDCRGPAPPVDRRSRRPAAAGRAQRTADRRPGAGAPAVHGAHRSGAQQHPHHRREALGSRARLGVEREAGRGVVVEAFSGKRVAA